jgi:hypothetical protein
MEQLWWMIGRINLMQTNSKEARYGPFYILGGKSCYYWLQWESEAQAEEMITCCFINTL